MQDRRIGVLCVDDNIHVGASVGARLGVERDFAWLGQLLAADTLVAETGRLGPDLVLLDIDMPGMDPFAALAEVAERRPQTRVVMYTGHVRKELIERAFSCGAWGYLSKMDSADSIVSALRRVAAGEVVFSSDARRACGMQC